MSLIEKIKNIFNREVTLPSGKLIIMSNHQSWGDSISWLDFERRILSGHMTPKPNVGDYIICNMESNKKYKFQINKIDCMNDPKDMFFAETNDIGYIE